MTDDDIERSLRRFRITGPPPHLQQRVVVRIDRQRTRRDVLGGCAVASAVVLLTYLGSWASWANGQRHLNEAMVNPEVAREVDDAGRVFGSYGRILAFRSALERAAAEPLAPRVVSTGERSPW